MYCVMYNKMALTKKEEILKWLKEFKRLSTTRIMGLIGLNFDYTKKYLSELKEEKKIKEIKETMATYWKLRK